MRKWSIVSPSQPTDNPVRSVLPVGSAEAPSFLSLPLSSSPLPFFPSFSPSSSFLSLSVSVSLALALAHLSLPFLLLSFNKLVFSVYDPGLACTAWGNVGRAVQPRELLPSGVTDKQIIAASHHSLCDAVQGPKET